MALSSNHFAHFETATLLVVDDDPVLREFAISHLSTPNVEVEVAADGAEAWHRLRKGGIDLALVDLEMPVMDGFELIGLIRSDQALNRLPVVVATGREDMVAVDRAYAEGATSFVVKPLNWRILSHQLSYVLRNSRDEALVRQALLSLRRKVLQQESQLLDYKALTARLEAGVPASTLLGIDPVRASGV